jgi:hypothetical protein
MDDYLKIRNECISDTVRMIIMKYEYVSYVQRIYIYSVIRYITVHKQIKVFSNETEAGKVLIII